MIVVMPHSPSGADLWPTFYPEVQLTPYDRTQAIPRDSRDQSLDPAACPTTGLERATRHPAAPLITVETPDPLQEPLRRRAPVISLPPEILAHIFELHVDHLSELTPNGNPSQSKGPYCLTQVCAFWKTVAESDPHLWTSIHFFFPEFRQNREQDVPNVEPVLDLHLKRSGALPISLTFTDHRMYHPATEELVSLLVKRLRTYGRRWKDITLQLSCVYFPLLFTFTPCDLPSLERLYINGDTFGVTNSTSLHLNLDSATNLKSFGYSGLAQLTETETIRLPWGTLEEVSFEFAPHEGTPYTLLRHFRNLPQCQNITICSLGIDRTRRDMGGGLFTLPRLHTLRIRRLSAYAAVRGVINPLTLPQLQTLEIDASHLISWNPRWHNRNFSGLLSRSGCNLLHLSIRDVDFPNEELMRCLALSPGLTSLCFIPCPRSQNISHIIRGMDVSRIVIHDQTGEYGQEHVGNAGPLVPQLRKVMLASSVNEYLDQMLAMIRSRVGSCARAAGVAPLHRAGVVFFDLWHTTDVVRVRGSEHRLGRVASFHANLERIMVSTNSNEEGDGEDALEASMMIDSPYLPEYIEVQ